MNDVQTLPDQLEAMASGFVQRLPTSVNAVVVKLRVMKPSARCWM